jgi:hypothetical protein
MIGVCVDGGGGFDARGSWMRRCWRAREGAKALSGACDRGYDAGYRAGTQCSTPQTHAPSLDRALVRTLVQLCHPDRHPPERFELANGATAALLQLLDGERQVA